jgi:hypothetical protein
MKKITTRKPKNVTSKADKKNAAARSKNTLAAGKKARAKKKKENIKNAKNTKKPQPIVAVGVIKKNNSFIKEMVILVIVAVALATTKDKKATKLFSKKETDDILKKAKEEMKNVMAIDPSNKYKVNLDFIRLSRPKFLTFINNVITLMSTSSDYPTPTPTLTTIKNMILLEASTRSVKNYVDANKYLAQLKDLMRALCVYIANTCDNNVVTLRSVGVRENITGKGTHKDAPRAAITSAKDTVRSGEVKVGVKSVEGMQGIQGQWSLKDGDGTWQTGPFSVGVFTIFTGLPVGTTVYLQVRFKSANGFGDWSESKPYVVR